MCDKEYDFTKPDEKAREEHEKRKKTVSGYNDECDEGISIVCDICFQLHIKPNFEYLN